MAKGNLDNATATNYTVYTIPADSPRFSDIVAKYRDTKLAALVAEPNIFAVKHADEVLHPLETWQLRLGNPSIILVCVATSGDDSQAVSVEDSLISGEWAGMCTIRGPLPYSTFQLPPSSGQPVPEHPERETRWQLCSVYTSIAHRGRGVAKRLVNACIETARDKTRALEKTKTLDGGENLKARVRLFCSPDKVFVTDMYQRMGFEFAGGCTLKEALLANGDKEDIPDDTSSSEEVTRKWETRVGLAMEKVVDT